jgi:hypothetical protein
LGTLINCNTPVPTGAVSSVSSAGGTADPVVNPTTGAVIIKASTAVNYVLAVNTGGGI